MFNEAIFTAADGARLAGVTWMAPKPKKTAILLLHGYAEHARRYRQFGERVAREGIHVFALEHRGHGKSAGKRGLVSSFMQQVDDASEYVQYLQKEHPDHTWFLFGHSMGGLVALYTSIRHENDVAGMLLSGPFLEPPDVPSYMRPIGRFFSKITPSLPVIHLDMDMISRDPDVTKRYREDPLVYTGNVRARTGIELDTAAESMRGQLHQITVPFWVGHGDLDRLAKVDGSRLLHQKASSTDKTLKIYNGLFHEILNEPEGEVVLHDMVQWLKKRIKA